MLIRFRLTFTQRSIKMEDCVMAWRSTEPLVVHRQPPARSRLESEACWPFSNVSVCTYQSVVKPQAFAFTSDIWALCECYSFINKVFFVWTQVSVCKWDNWATLCTKQTFCGLFFCTFHQIELSAKKIGVCKQNVLNLVERTKTEQEVSMNIN